MTARDGGDRIAGFLAAQGVPFLFTLCGGHISPILVAAKHRGIRVIDVRDEATAVFAADAVARLTGSPGVAVVTAGPGATNTITALKNAQLSQSPIVIIGGATATILKGRGALQDIDQLALFRPHVKRTIGVSRVGDLVPALQDAFLIAQEGVPGPVFVECPVDVLYPEHVVREWYGAASPDDDAMSLGARFKRAYLRRHLDRVFGTGEDDPSPEPALPVIAPVTAGDVQRAAVQVAAARRPVLLVGSQAMLRPGSVAELVDAVDQLGLPVFLSGMARGLLGPAHPLLMRHQRGDALREADLVVLAGVPCDFRLDYGRQINRKAAVVAVNRSRRDLTRNRRPTVPLCEDPAEFLCRLAREAPPPPSAWTEWRERLRNRDRVRQADIERREQTLTEYVNPLALCRAVDDALDPDSVLILDGGDFAATASYIVSPRRPLAFLDPGPFGTLGVGAGFALGAKLCRPGAEVWILYGDGAAAFSLAEFDSFARHGLPVIAVVGNDAAWTQIARGQTALLHDDVGTVLRRTAYHTVAEGYGGRGFLADAQSNLPGVLADAKAAAREGIPALVNVWIGKTDFREGSVAI